MSRNPTLALCDGSNRVWRSNWAADKRTLMPRSLTSTTARQECQAGFEVEVSNLDLKLTNFCEVTGVPFVQCPEWGYYRN